MSLVVNAISQIGQAQIEQFIRLEQFIVVFSRNLMILLLTPIFTISLIECFTFCYRLVLRHTIGKLSSREVAAFKFKEVQSPWKLDYEWTRKFIGRREKKRD